jgi:hypothetical protein
MKKTLHNSPDVGGSASVSPAVGANFPAGPIVPEFIRLPKAGSLCAWTGLSRGKLNDLILARDEKKPAVESFSLKQRGQAKGTRLIVLKSLMTYLNRIRKEQAG